MVKTLGEARANGETGTRGDTNKKDRKTEDPPKVVYQPVPFAVPHHATPAYPYHHPPPYATLMDAPQPFDNTPQVKVYQPRLDSQHYASRYYPQAPAYAPVQYTYPPQTYGTPYGIYPYPGANQQYTYAAHPPSNPISKPPPPAEPAYYPHPYAHNNTAYAYPAYPYTTPHDPHRTYGRTRTEVLQDNEHIAATTGVDKPRDMAPKNPKPDELFRVYYPNGDVQLRNFATVEAVHYPGEWRRDPRDGSVCFVKGGMGVGGQK